MEMKGLSVRQPFASQIVIGEKTIEWRSKPFNWRGPLVICASKSAIIELDNGKRLPVGVALGIVDVVGCRPMTRKDLVAACCEDYEDEMYGFAWELVSPRELQRVHLTRIQNSEPTRQHGLSLCPGWHDRNVLDD